MDEHGDINTNSGPSPRAERTDDSNQDVADIIENPHVTSKQKLFIRLLSF